MAATTSGWQYAVPNDTLVAWPAVSQAVADKLESTVSTGTAWTTFTPTLTTTSGSVTSYVVDAARYIKIGKTVTVSYNVTVTNNGTGAGQTNLTLPVAALAGTRNAGGGINVTNGISLVVWLPSTTVVRFATYSFGYTGATTNVVSITYEAA